MKILCNQKLSASQQVNRIGRYIYKAFKGIKYVKSSNTYDVYITLLYALPEDNEVNEMILDINITTYQNKIRVNVTEVSPNERTIGYDVYLPDQLQDLASASKLIYQKIIKHVSKTYSDYDFLL